MTIREAPRNRTLLGYDRNGIAIYKKLKPKQGLNIKKSQKRLKVYTKIQQVSEKQRAKNKTWKEIELLALKRANYTCEAKLEGCEGDKYLQGHHIIFRSKGGKHTLENTLICCSHCHDLLHGIKRGKENE